MYRDDVRVIEGGGCARLSLKAAYTVRVNGEMGRQKFERDLAIEPGVFRQIDFSHAARAQ